MKNIDSDLIRGNIDTIILKTMLDGDKYGLDIIKEVESRSNGTYELKQPTLYSCLKRLENQQLISSYWLDSDIGGRRHYYKLTEKGHETLEKKQEEWAKSKFIIDNLLSNYNYDEYRLVKKDDYDKIIEGKQFVYETAPSTQTESTSFVQTDETAKLTNSDTDEDYEHVNDDSDLTEFNELESSPVQENFSEAEEQEDSEVRETENEPENEFDFNYGYSDNNDDKLETEETDENDSSYGLSFDDNESSEEDRPLEPSSKRRYYIDFDDEEDQETLVNNQALEEENQPSEEVYDDESEFDEEQEADLFNNDNRQYVQSSEIGNEDEQSEETATAPEMADQTENESNILKLLRRQDDEEINTYYGDQKSYVNYLNKADEYDNAVQSSMLDMDSSSLDNEIEETINEFSSAIEELNNFNFTEDSETEIQEEIKNSDDEYAKEQIEVPEIETDVETTEINAPENEYVDDFKEELDELNRNKNNGFFNSFDNPDYEVTNIKQTPAESTFDYDYSLTDSSDASYESENEYEETNDVFNFTFANSNESEPYEETTSSYNETETQSSSLYDIDQIISNNASSYTNQYTPRENDAFTSFTPKYTSENYKQKLSNLSTYSKVTDEKKCSNQINEDALNKAKDIESLKAEFEQEGIKIKEFKKYNSAEHSERTYLLSNKIKLVNSLILLFGYVFILSAVYIILNNTGFRNTHGFSFTYFLYGFIPFGVYALYHLIMFMIDPYKKTPAKLAPRILIFISLIITVQLLLITYCVNLQLGFYSFTQEQYNHLLWVIPTIISFAPIICNATYIALFYSKNFNV